MPPNSQAYDCLHVVRVQPPTFERAPRPLALVMCPVFFWAGVKDLMAWTDMETFRRTPHTAEEKRNQKAKDVRGSWLTKKYFFGPDSPATREGQNLVSYKPVRLHLCWEFKRFRLRGYV